MLADGALIGFFPHERAGVRIAVGDAFTLHVQACPGPLPSEFAACRRLAWREAGTITHRFVAPTFSWTDGATPWFEDTGGLARKGVAAHYHVLKGHVLDPVDGIIANPDPVWLDTAT